MRQTVSLIAAPTSMSPGGYVPVAYAERTTPNVPRAELGVEPSAGGWRIQLRWACAAPVRSIAGETDRFLDACALLVPVAADAPWISMGEPGKPVEGILWKADRDRPWRMHAEGLGTMARADAPSDWRVGAAWHEGFWEVSFELPEWPLLTQHRQIAFAIWAGAEQERAGLKSVCPGWLALA